MANEKSRQEQAYDYVTETFLKLLQIDERIGYDHKKSVIAFYEDMFAHEGIRNNMILAFSNFLNEIDKRMDASRKAGIVQFKDILVLGLKSRYIEGEQLERACSDLEALSKMILESESAKEENITNVGKIDLSEVGGGDEDDTPLL